MNHEQAKSAPHAAAQVIELSELRSAPGAAAAASQHANPLHGIRARLEVCVGEVELSVGELLAARENEVVALDAGVDDLVELRHGTDVVARGRLVAIDGQFGFRIIELPELRAP